MTFFCTSHPISFQKAVSRVDVASASGGPTYYGLVRIGALTIA